MDYEDTLEDEDESEDEEITPGWRERKRQKFQRKNQKTINAFLGAGRKATGVGIIPRYYCDLLTWAFHRHIERTGWKVVRTLGYHSREPVFIDVDTGVAKENLMMDGQLLIENEDFHLIVTLEANPRYQGSILVEGIKKREKEINAFVSGVMEITKKENFYRGKKFEFSGRIHFLNVGEKSWDSIIMDDETKKDIQSNTIDFLKRGEEWAKYGIPLKRGVLLAGEPGTGKTIVCKVLMSLADGITCITTSAYLLDEGCYIDDLYDIAQDLTPSIVFIEDIDSIGQDRMEYGYQKVSALTTLLAILDGVEERKGIITVATTNCLEVLDKALSQRPSRFDRVIKIARPSLDQRKELLNRLCQKIPLDESTKGYIALKTEGYTPAQIQEMVYSLVIQHPSEQKELSFVKTDIDRAINCIKGKSKYQIGFIGSDNHNGHKDLINIKNLAIKKEGK